MFITWHFLGTFMSTIIIEGTVALIDTFQIIGGNTFVPMFGLMEFLRTLDTELVKKTVLKESNRNKNNSDNLEILCYANSKLMHNTETD